MLQNDCSAWHIWNATAEKRYVNFIHTVADRDCLWLIGTEDGELIVEENGVEYLCLWPEEIFAQYYMEKSNLSLVAKPFSVSLSDFIEKLESFVSSPYQCMVFPTEQNTKRITIRKLLLDLDEELEMY